MRSIDYLREHKERSGLSFRKMAKQAGVSEAYCYLLIDNDQPPTLDKAQQIAVGMDMKMETFLNIVFRDRMLKFLEREKLNDHNSTEEMKKIAEVFKKWDPEKESLKDALRYIMETNKLNKSLTVPDFACMVLGLRKASDLTDNNFLTGGKKKVGGGERRGSARKERSLLSFGGFAGLKVIAVRN